MKNQNDWYNSIIAILIAMCCFWPVGCVLLYLRWVKYKGKFKANNIILFISAIGFLIIGIGGIIVFIDSHDIADFLLALIMFITPGSVCGYFGYKRAKKAKGYQKYLDYINARRKVNLDDMCNTLNIDYETAINYITDMIKKEMINGFISNNELIINQIDINGNAIQEYKEPKKDRKIIKCKECGAKKSVIIGDKKECEYCGTILQ